VGTMTMVRSGAKKGEGVGEQLKKTAKEKEGG
jgi:hypothetical protein